ncbi:phospholipase D2 [Phlebotomus papatasi]|uniref:phospholipase D2 n=1 Tax=Phlebotomus papatasi TaxID=29031 RepID=UPI0024845B1F|nr:phospholipase D2 [Phlebotomus papatasi]
MSLRMERRLHRSISQLLASTDNMSLERGTSNPAVDDETSNVTIGGASTATKREGGSSLADWSCVNDTLSPDSEYDEGLGFPDSVTILSMVDGPVLVTREKDDEVVQSEIPFLTVYKEPQGFKSIQRRVFIPGVDIHVSIVNNERSSTTHLLNPNLYTIELTHGPFVWHIKKRYKHFYALHQQLRVFRTSLNIPFPTRTHKERRASFRNNYTAPDECKDGKTGKKRRKGALPRFPNKPDSLIPVESLPVRIKQLEEYLYNLVNINLYRNHHEMLNFLEVSEQSFIGALGDKGKEGPILKRTGSTRPGQTGCNFCGCFAGACCIRCSHFCSDILCRKWRDRWFFVKESYFGYMRPKDGTIRCIILFDQGFEVASGIIGTGMRTGLQIVTYSRHFVVKTWTRRKAKEWMNFLKLYANNQAKDFTQPHPHNSFVPVRNSCSAGWFVDGAGYMSAVADALEGATEEIYIADWWLSPEIYMKRPAIDGDYWRLDQILRRKAEQGIRVFILLYKEVEMALGINSYYSKQRLAATHDNIKVLRHPDHARVGVFLWAHHEKIVVVDQTYAFVGGIDLCYGRWDDYQHRLTDLGSIATASAGGSATHDPLSGGFVPSRSASVPVMDPNSVEKPNLPVLQPGDKLLIPPGSATSDDEMCVENIKQNTPEMERRNMLDKLKENMKTKGKDIMHRLTSMDPEPSRSVPQSPTDRNKKYNVTKSNIFFNEDELADGKKGDSICALPPQNEILTVLDGQAKYWMGKDYTNFIAKDFANLDAPYVDMIDRGVTPRMPWHDIGAVVTGAAARDVARHFIQRWNAVKLEKARDNQAYPYLIPKSYRDIRVHDSFLTVALQKVSCQVVRSVSSWSCGFIESDVDEQSIHDAYIETITNAQHYIYIENQFFITLNQGNSFVKNQIGESLYKRIVRAHRERSVFRVIVIMPLLPGFEGDVGGTTGNALRAITHWNYESISRGKSSILQRLKAAGIEDPSQYISFHSLRTHSLLNCQPVTELIYVHSKLLIADDKVVICGSANINDRSMIGTRDSEIAVIITDEVFQEGLMDGNRVRVGVFASGLRKFLFREHLGLIDPDPDRIPIDVTDPTIDAFWHGQWQRTSQRNTKIYDEVFRCIPTDAVTTISGLKKYVEEPSLAKLDPGSALKELQRIQGYLVDLPLKFLEDEILTPPTVSKEGLIPTSVWT